MRRITRDATSQTVIEDLKLPYDKVQMSIGGSRLTDSRIDRPLKKPTDIQVEVEMLPVDSVGDEADPLEEPLAPREASLYRAIVARINFLAADRPDVQFASKEASRKMSCPRHVDWAAVKRIGRYLAGRPRAVGTP